MQPFGRFEPKLFGLIYTLEDPSTLNVISAYFVYFNSTACVIPLLIYAALFLIIRCFKKTDAGSTAAVHFKADIKITLACCTNNLMLIIHNVYTNYLLGSTVWHLWAGTLFMLLILASTNPILLFVMSSTIRRRILNNLRRPVESSVSSGEQMINRKNQHQLETAV